MKFTRKQLQEALQTAIYTFGFLGYYFKNPIYVIPKRRMKDLATWQNDVTENGDSFHLITINSKEVLTYQDLMDSMHHELIHAIQYEQKRPTDHDDLFCDFVIKLGKLGYNTGCNDLTIKDLNNAIERLKNEAPINF